MLTFDVIALNIWGLFLPANGASRNLVPQVAVGGTCTANGSQPDSVSGTLAHSCPLITVNGLSEMIFVPERSSTLKTRSVCTLLRMN